MASVDFPQLPQLHSFTSRQRAAPNNSEETRIESCWIYSIFTYLHIICNIQRELAVEVSWTRWLKYLKSHLHLKAPKIHKTWVWVNTYRYILVGWTSIYQLFWGSLGTRVLTHPHLMENPVQGNATNRLGRPSTSTGMDQWLGANVPADPAFPSLRNKDNIEIRCL